MSATSHWIYEFLGRTAEAIPVQADGTIWRLPLPKGMPRRKVYFGISLYNASLYMNFKSFLIFRNCGEEVLRLPYGGEDQDVGGGVFMFCFPYAPNGSVYEKSPANSIQCSWLGAQFCIPGFDLRIVADEVQWWYDLSFSAALTISNCGVIFLGIFSEADPPAPVVTVPTFAPPPAALPPSGPLPTRQT